MADASALAIPEGKQSLAGALLKFSREAGPAHATLSFFADRTLIDLRIEFMSGHVYIPLPITWSKIMLSLMILLTPFALFIPQSKADTTPTHPCREGGVIQPHPFPAQPLRYDFSTIPSYVK